MLKCHDMAPCHENRLAPQKSVFAGSVLPYSTDLGSVADILVSNWQYITHVMVVSVQQQHPKPTCKNAAQDQVPSNADGTWDMNTAAQKQIKEILEQIKLPGWFDTDEYIQRCRSEFVQYMKKQPVLQQELARVMAMDTDGKNTKSNLRGIMSLLDALYHGSVDAADGWYSRNIAEFLDSDLPCGVYEMYHQSFVGRIMMLSTVTSSLSKLQTALYVRRSNKARYNGSVLEFQEKMMPLITAQQEMARAESTLRIYVSVSNASNMDDLFGIASPCTRTMDKDVFARHVRSLESSLAKLQKILSRHHAARPDFLRPNTDAARNFGRDLARCMAKHT